MIIVDKALLAKRAANHPIKVGLVGAGTMGNAISHQIINSAPGLQLVAIANRHPDRAVSAFTRAGVADVEMASSLERLEVCVQKGQYAVTDDPLLLCQIPGIDAIIDATSSVSYGAEVALAAIQHHKHLVLVNAELDGTLGPILKVYADRAGIVVTAADGDQPGTEVNLYRFVKGMGFEPLLCGNIKSLQDHYRTPETQESFSKRWGLQPYMATSFADGTKISFEQALVANATGMRVATRGMLGYEFMGHVEDICSLYDVDQLRQWGGIVDYVLGAKPSPGIFILATHDDPRQRAYLQFYKMGDGPLYVFYTPYHLAHFEVPSTVARAVLFGDAVATPLDRPRVDVVATAKRDLRAGETLDGIGHYTTYGQCENSDHVSTNRLLPIGLVEGCQLVRDVPQDRVLTYDDVRFPAERLCDRLRAEQDAYWAAGVG